MTFLSAVLLFGFLIFIHELGHFIVAKSNGVKVLKFSLGFGPRVIGRQIGETEYILSAIPLGGYVKMLGEEAEEEAEPADDTRSYKNQSVLKRIAIVFSGPLFNFLAAVVIFFFIFATGVPVLLPVIGEVLPDSPAARALLEKGDRIVEIDGTSITQWAEVTKVIHENPERPLSVKIRRGETVLAITVSPERKTTKNLFGEDKEVGLIGVKPEGETTTIKESVPEALRSAFVRTWDIAVLTVVGIVKIIQRIIPTDTIGGPILIFQLAEKQASAGVLSFFTFAAVISINLAVLNLLPIPVLDGGHIMMLLLEKIRRKPLSERTLVLSQRIGMALIVVLMALALYNDIFRLVDGKPLP